MFKEPKNRFQEIDSASLYSLAGLYDNLIPTRFLATISCSKISALDAALITRQLDCTIWNLVCNFRITAKTVLLVQFQNNRDIPVQYSIMENLDESDCSYESRKEYAENFSTGTI